MLGNSGVFFMLNTITDASLSTWKTITIVRPKEEDGFMPPSAYAARSSSRNQAFPPLDTQHDSGAVEFGAMCGPSKYHLLVHGSQEILPLYSNAAFQAQEFYRVLVKPASSRTHGPTSVFSDHTATS